MYRLCRRLWAAKKRFEDRFGGKVWRRLRTAFAVLQLPLALLSFQVGLFGLIVVIFADVVTAFAVFVVPVRCEQPGDAPVHWSAVLTEDGPRMVTPDTAAVPRVSRDPTLVVDGSPCSMALSDDGLLLGVFDPRIDGGLTLFHCDPTTGTSRQRGAGPIQLRDPDHQTVAEILAIRTRGLSGWCAVMGTKSRRETDGPKPTYARLYTDSGAGGTPLVLEEFEVKSPIGAAFVGTDPIVVDADHTLHGWPGPSMEGVRSIDAAGIGNLSVVALLRDNGKLTLLAVLDRGSPIHIGGTKITVPPGSTVVRIARPGPDLLVDQVSAMIGVGSDVEAFDVPFDLRDWVAGASQ